MKRPLAAVMVKDAAGNVSQDSIYRTVKNAKARARELALVKVRAGMQTDVHTDRVFKFPDRSEIWIREVRMDYGGLVVPMYYHKIQGYVPHDFPVDEVKP